MKSIYGDQENLYMVIFEVIVYMILEYLKTEYTRYGSQP